MCKDDFYADLIKKAALEGATEALACYKKDLLKNERHLNDTRIKNTRMLFENYRDFKVAAIKSIYNAKQAENAIDILDLMWDPHNHSDMVVESIKASAVRTNIIVAHIDSMLKIYKELCYSSKNDSERRRYDCLYLRYIAEKPLTIEEIAAKKNVVPRCVYKDIDAAIERMAKLIFGVDYLINYKKT